MSDKVTLIAAAQVNVASGAISFKSNYGFKTASRSSPGVYELNLEHSHDARKLVIGVTANNLTGGEIQASPVGTGDTKGIQLTNFDLSNAAADTSFFITVHHVK